MLRPGQQVGNYRVEGLVGRGGQGIVYRAVHERLGTTHALKMLLLELGPLRDRLLEEGRIQARLRSPHVVPVTDAVEVDGALGLVAEYVQGAPLDVWMATESRPLEARLALFRDVTAGVAAAHAARIVHRDLKPGNVLVEERDGRPFARVTDFGVAKVLDDARARGATLPGMAIGTPGYMAPEQLRDAATVDARADVFALGCLLYELVAGTRAWPEVELGPYAFALESTPPPSLTRVPELPPALAARLDAVVAACLARDPRDRPADAAAVLVLLESGRAPVVRTPTAVPAAALTAVPFGATPADEAGAPIESRAGRSRPGLALGGLLLVVVLAAVGIGLSWNAGPTEDGAGEGAGAAGARKAGADEAASAPAGAEPEGGAPEDGGNAATGAEGAERGGTGVASASAGGAGDAPGGPDQPGARVPAAGIPSRSTGGAAEAATTGRAPPTSTPTRAPSPATTTPAPAPTGPRPGRVVVEGDGELAWLQFGETRVPPSSVPPGHYQVFARFGAEGVVEAGSVAVQEGATVRLRCDAGALRCVPSGSP